MPSRERARERKTDSDEKMKQVNDHSANNMTPSRRLSMPRAPTSEMTKNTLSLMQQICFSHRFASYYACAKLNTFRAVPAYA